MKVALWFLIAFSWLFQFCGRGEEPEPPKRNYLSFKLNGKLYTLNPTQFNSSSYANNNFNMQFPATIATSSYSFDIRKVGSNVCGVLIPRDYPLPFVNDRENCVFDIPVVAPDGSSLPAEKVYYYQSGNITYTKKDCGSRPFFNFLCLCTQQTQMCNLSGTFELTFKNRLNETVTLTEGKLLLYDVYQ